MNIYRDIKQLPSFNKSVITIGSFDGIHLGHRKILKRVINLAKEINGTSTLITFYPHPRKVVDPSMNTLYVLNSLEEKIDQLTKIGLDNLIIIPFSFEFSRMSPREYIENFLIKNFSPSYVVMGYDHRFGLNRAGDINMLREYSTEHNFEVIEIPKQELEEIGISSTIIRKSLLSGDIAEANSFLGAAYIISGKVMHGDKLGSKLGYPTANIQIHEKDKLIPKSGIYAVKVDVEGSIFDGVMYIGPRPTIGDNLPTNVEVNIFDFDQNIYERNVTIHIIAFVRGDQKFESLEALKDQMKLDEQVARDLLAENIAHTSSQRPIATIAILNYNGNAMLESYLPMVEYSSQHYSTETIVIDNNSDDESIEYLEEWHPEVKVVQLSKNYGFAEGYNRGLQQVDSEFTVLLNSDVLIKENWLDPILDLFKSDPTIGIIQPVIMSLESKESYEYAGAAGGFIDSLGYPFCRGRIFDTLENNNGQYANDMEIFWASGAAMVIRTKLFNDLGGFDVNFFAHQEEIDLCWRAKKAGFKVMCCTSSQVYHLGGGTLEYGSSNKIFYNFRNNLMMISKNEPFSKLLWLLPSKLILDGIAALKFALSGRLDYVLAILKAHVAYYVLLPNVIEANNNDNKNVKNTSIGVDRSEIGKYNGSIVWSYYIKGVTYFSKLKW